MLSLAVFLPIAAGLLMLAVPPRSRRVREIAVEGVTIATSLLVLCCLIFLRETPQTLVHLTMNLPITFCIDGVGSVFTVIVAVLWPLATLYGFEYMEHEGGENHFFAVYTLTYGVTLGISMAANAITLYTFYEFLTLCTLPLVIHGSKQESRRAGRAYALYSFLGAALAFIGVMIAVYFGGNQPFTMGGVLGEAFKAEHPVLLEIGYLCMFLGFGVKAAIVPLHAWLPMASVAPTPVTALLHAVAVVKSGVFGVIRMTYFVVGAHLLRGTAAQAAVVVLAAMTIVYGSSRAVREHHFKRRLAYSTVANLSYIMLAAVMMSAEGLVAALAHMLFHALIKITLFFCAGAVLVRTGRTQVESLRGMGRVMPFTCAVYTLAALALMGTPLLPGFISKWMIGSALIAEGSWMGIVGLVALLLSAILTAIYTMSVTFAMYFRPFEPDAHADGTAIADPGMKMKLPLMLLCAGIVLCGLFSNQIITVLQTLCTGVL